MNNNYENLPAVLNANQLAAALGISRAGAYQLLNTGTRQIQRRNIRPYPQHSSVQRCCEEPLLQRAAPSGGGRYGAPAK